MEGLMCGEMCFELSVRLCKNLTAFECIVCDMVCYSFDFTLSSFLYIESIFLYVAFV